MKRVIPDSNTNKVNHNNEEEYIKICSLGRINLHRAKTIHK
jgi:hypothetical protein